MKAVRFFGAALAAFGAHALGRFNSHSLTRLACWPFCSVSASRAFVGKPAAPCDEHQDLQEARLHTLRESALAFGTSEDCYTEPMR